MKILKTDGLVLERIKVMPITNAELNAAQKKMNQFIKIDNPTAKDIKPGVAVIIEDDGVHTMYIAFDAMKLAPCFDAHISGESKKPFTTLFIRYAPNNLTAHFSYWSFDQFMPTFPVNKNWKDVRIVEVYDANINTENILNCDILKKEYDTVYEKILKYKQSL